MSVLNQRGMILMVILWVMLLISSLMSHLLFSLTLNSKLTNSMLPEIQQFEIVETALLQGERKLAQLVSETPDIITHSSFNLPSETYKNYRITFNVTRLPQVFCILPMRLKGYYYELTVTLQKNYPFVANKISLQSTIALPGHVSCQAHLPKRPVGRSAWCQPPLN